MHVQSNKKSIARTTAETVINNGRKSASPTDETPATNFLPVMMGIITNGRSTC